jgi:two-component system, NtrC family, response regulator GlrR
MTRHQVVIIDPHRHSCSQPACVNLRSLLAHRACLEITEAPWPPSCAPDGPGPSCIVLRGCSAASVHAVRRAWEQPKLFGVFCPAETVDGVARAVRHGVDDFVSCPFSEQEFLYRLSRLLGDSAGFERPADQHIRLANVVGESDALLSLIAKLPRIAASDATCLLVGETGTGKELLARGIHYMSKRADQAFVAVNCGALPDLLLENELFGHAKGAYTDASRDQVGLLNLASEGTLFLDEVDALSPSAQVKLLRVLQDHEYRPLGSPHSLVANIRVVAATNTDVRQCVAQKTFRDDLFHRLNVISLTIPPLRARRSDIPMLAEHFLRKFARQHERNIVAIRPNAMLKLTRYDWPGNVRELEGTMERAVILSTESVLDADDFDLPLSEPEPSDNPITFQNAKREAIRTFESTYLSAMLAAHGGNVTRAARAAGKERRAFQRLLQKYALDRPTAVGETA